MTPFEYLKTILKMLPEISKQTGYPVFYLARYFTLYYLKYRVQIDEFQTLRLYDYSPRRVAQFLLWKQCKKCSDLLNAGAAPEELAVFDDKHLFNVEYARFVRRDWLYLPESTPEQVQLFMDAHPTFLIKACRSTQGKGIFKQSRDDMTPQELLDTYGKEPFLLEALIVQHPILDAVNPHSVNTIRFIAAKKGDRVAFVGAGLRCGGADQFVDNFHHGGAAYPIDLDTGIITAHGIDLQGEPILRHPTTGTVMPGLCIPHWDEVKRAVTEAMYMSRNVGYIGWDVAVTPDGIELVEGNINYPGNNIIQIDGPGAYARLLALINE